MSSTTNKNIIKQKLVALYKQNKDSINSNLSNFFNSHRDNAINIFDKLGLPTKGEEEYKYTDLIKAFSKTHAYSFKPSTQSTDKQTVFKCSVPNLDTYNLIIENGWYNKKNNSKIDNKVIVMSLNDASKDYGHLIEKYYNKLAAESKASTTHLNTAFAQDGLFMYIPDNIILDKPIQIINILKGQNPLMTNQRNLIITGKNSQAKILFCDHTLSNQDFLSNTVTEIFIEENAVFDCYNIQNQHNTSAQISSIYIKQMKNSNSLINTLTLHGGFIRNNVNIQLNEEFCEANIYGLSIADGQQHVDNYTFIDHSVPNCNSIELYKNIIDDNATGVFSGKILVRPDAQKTLAFQSNKNICLTDTARFYTKPQLEIYADDVKCSHGATVGQIDEDALFYLKSRGIGDKEARMMLMFAFVHEVIKNIRVPILADSYGEMVEKRLRGETTRCDKCVVNCS